MPQATILNSLREAFRFSTVMAIGLIYAYSFVASNASADVTLDSEGIALVKLINDYRAENNLPPFQVSITLTRASQWMSEDMASKDYFSHNDLTGRSPFDRMKAFGYSYNTWKGENIAAGYEDAVRTFDLWKNSPGHNANMLHSNFNAIGIGRAFSETSTYRWYWTTDFGGYVDGTIDPSNPTATPTPGEGGGIGPAQLINPSFETGIDGWETTGHVTAFDGNGVTDGQFAAKLVKSSSLSQELEVTPNATYTLRMDLSSTRNVNSEIGVRFMGSKARGGKRVRLGKFSRKAFRLRFHAPAGAEDVKVYVKSTANRKNAELIVDNIVLVKN